MANAHTLGSLLKAIADSIREKLDTTDLIPANEFPEKIYEMNKDRIFEIVTGEVTELVSSDFEGVTEIPNYKFSNCKKLKTVTLSNTITSIGRYAFQNCTNITTINVPWASGVVTNAPWGAPTTATINYNYGGE